MAVVFAAGRRAAQVSLGFRAIRRKKERNLLLVIYSDFVIYVLNQNFLNRVFT